jgi:riboflavin synthase
VDTIGRVTHLTPEGENWWFGVQVPAEFARYIVPKGSITIDGVSLTVARWQNNIAEVAVIPYTYLHTNIRDRKPGDAVNLEGDVLGKYVESYLEARSFSASGQSQLTVARLVEEGF